MNADSGGSLPVHAGLHQLQSSPCSVDAERRGEGSIQPMLLPFKKAYTSAVDFLYLDTHCSVSRFHYPELEKLLESFIKNYRSLSHFKLFFISNKLLKMIYENMYMTEHE